MASIGPKRIKSFVEPLRVQPGSKVRLPRDFDPGSGVGQAKPGQAKELLKEKEISEDEERKAQEDIQKLTDRFVARVDEMLQRKEADLMAI